MPRPKGSKNKKKLLENLSLEDLISKEEANIASLEEEKNSILAVIEEHQAKLKSVKNELSKAIKKHKEYQDEISKREASAAAAAAKEALSNKIDELLADGKTLDELLEKLK